METVSLLACPPDVACWSQLDPDPAFELQDDRGWPVWDDAVLKQLREQAAAGCLLCSLDDWTEKDGDDDA